MITLKITKDKYIAIINGITGIIQKMRDDLHTMEYDINRAQTNAHLDVWEDLSRKMRSKLVMMEDKPGNHKVNFSVNGIEALLFVVYGNTATRNPISWLRCRRFQIQSFKGYYSKNSLIS